MAGRHRASSATYLRRQILAVVLLLVVAGFAIWFLLFRGNGDSTGGGPPCDEYRADLIAAYEPLRVAQADLIELLSPIDEGGTLRPRRLSAAQGAVDEARTRYEAIDALRMPPEELTQIYRSLRPTANEFVALAERVVAALTDELELPTATPGAQLQALFDLEPPPEQIPPCD
jgi:hypothetical protein